MMKRIGLLIVYLAACVVACLAYFFLRNHVNIPIADAGWGEWALVALISAAIGFAFGMWRRGNPWYVYVVAALICLGTQWLSYFFTGFYCLYIAHSC